MLSFVYLAIYWNNHHHLLHTVTRVDGLILWANSNLLFWLSLIPVATAWMGENFLAPIPTAVYGAMLLMPAIAYFLLQKAIIHKQGAHSVLASALGSDIKGKISLMLYLVGIGLAFVYPWLSIAALCAGRRDLARSRSADREGVAGRLTPAAPDLR